MSKELPQDIVWVATGLGDHVKGLDWAMKSWPLYGLHPLIQKMDWYNPANTYEQQIQRILNEVRHLTDNNHRVSVLGTSAGGSMAFNVFKEARKQGVPVHRAVAVCSRLAVGAETGWRSFAAKTKTSPLFASSVLELAKKRPYFTPGELKRMMAVRPKWDEMVPPPANRFEGAYNLEISMIEHGLSIMAALKFPDFAHYIIDFLCQD